MLSYDKHEKVKRGDSVTKLWQKIAAIIATLVAMLYTYSLFARFTGFFTGGVPNMHTRGMAMVITAAIFVLTIIRGEKKWSFRIAVVLGHFLFYAFCTQIIDLILNVTVGPENLERWNAIYSLLIIPVCLTIITIVGGYINMMDIRRTEYRVNTSKNIRAEGYKILFIADLHFGNAIKREQLRDLVFRLNMERPDLVLIGGDVIDEHTSRRQVVRAFGELGKIESRYGSYFVFGNHDRGEYDKTAHLISEDRLKGIIKRSGIKNLDSQCVPINDDLMIIGRDDKYYEKKTVNQLMEGIDKERFIIFMDHQPYDFKEKSEAEVDLALSGHTHGGQFYPLGKVIKRMQDMNYGIEKWGKMTAIVTAGLSGGNIAVRTSNHSEYVIIYIEPKKKG